MIKRYQVFVSSTYEDLQQERQEVMQALLELDCIPAGMELFPAADDDQWTLIKEMIRDCDYYIVIVGGRYGSIGPMGISFTEMEYRYAVDIGKPVLAFLHKDPTTLQAFKVDTEPELQAKLREFRTFTQRKMCRFWSTAAELGGMVSRSLVRIIKHAPAVGWVKADQLPTGNPALELLELRKQLEQTKAQLRDAVRGANSVGLVQTFGRQGDFGTESDWLTVLGSAIERVDMMGRTLYGWTQSVETAEIIIKKIREEQVKFRVLIMAQNNHALPILEENRVNIAAALTSKLAAVSQWTDRIRLALSPDERLLFDVRCFENLPLYFSYLRIDDSFFVTFYLSSANSSSSPMIRLQHVGGSWTTAYAREFETIWTLSSTLPSSGFQPDDGAHQSGAS